MKYSSPLRYPGGKNKAVPLFKDVIAANGMSQCVYVEPFAGGASVALSLLYSGDAERVIINDADPSIYAFWHSCLHENSRFCELLTQTSLDAVQWNIQKSIYSTLRNEAMAGREVDLLALGFATFYLNRTNRSGIIKGGLIGGRKQTGEYLMNARFNKDDLMHRIQKIVKYSDKIELHCENAKNFLLNHHRGWPDNTLVYCDPPYVKKGKGLYMNYFSEDDHRELARVIEDMKNLKWVMTYDIDPLIKDIYKSYRIKKMALSYSAYTHTSKAEEYIIFSDYVIVPIHPSINEI